jgi:hypothetical protein
MSNFPKGSNIKNIRHYVMGLIYQNGFTSVRVPSSLELARQFGVTRRTARVVLEGLIREGYLIGKNGIGTFTNPAQGFKLGHGPQLPLIGVGVNDCSNFYYDYRSGMRFAAAMQAILEHGANVYPLVHSSCDFEQFCLELRHAQLGGLFLVQPDFSPEQQAVLTSLGFPVVSLEGEFAGASRIRYDRTAALQEMFSIALQEKRHEIMLLYTRPEYFEDDFGIFRDLCDQPGCPVHLRVIQADAENFEERFAAALESGPAPELLLIGWRMPPLVIRMLSEAGIDYRNGCRLMVSDDFLTDREFCGYVVCPDRQAAVSTAAAELMRRIGDPAAPPRKLSIPAFLHRVE